MLNAIKFKKLLTKDVVNTYIRGVTVDADGTREMYFTVKGHVGFHITQHDSEIIAELIKVGALSYDLVFKNKGKVNEFFKRHHNETDLLRTGVRLDMPPPSCRLLQDADGTVTKPIDERYLDCFTYEERYTRYISGQGRYDFVLVTDTRDDFIQGLLLPVNTKGKYATVLENAGKHLI